MEVSSTCNQTYKKTTSNTIKAAAIGAGAFGAFGALSNYSLQKDIVELVKRHPGCSSVKPLILSDNKLLKKGAELIENLSKQITASGNKILKTEIAKYGLKCAAEGAAIIGGVALLVNLAKNAIVSKNTENK